MASEPGKIEFSVLDPHDAEVGTILDQHLAFARGETPPEGVFALDANGLADPAVTLFGARLEGRLVGVGALKMLGGGLGELKSMHTVRAARRLGVGKALVEHLLSEARSRGCRRVSLETGAMEAFAPARALYATCGFEVCPPFGDYIGSSTSVCMTISLV
jgi:putative acetyltransferase